MLMLLDRTTKRLQSIVVAILFAFFMATTVFFSSNQAIAAEEDPQIHARMMRLATVLRCLVCQNQTIADSHAELAADLRNQIIELIHQGKTDDEIMDYMTARYGDFVLYRPPLKTTTVLLWLGPLLLVIAGGWALYRAAEDRQKNAHAEPSLTPEQKRLTDALLTQESSKS